MNSKASGLQQEILGILREVASYIDVQGVDATSFGRAIDELKIAGQGEALSLVKQMLGLSKRAEDARLASMGVLSQHVKDREDHIVVMLQRFYKEQDSYLLDWHWGAQERLQGMQDQLRKARRRASVIRMHFRQGGGVSPSTPPELPQRGSKPLTPPRQRNAGSVRVINPASGQLAGDEGRSMSVGGGGVKMLAGGGGSFESGSPHTPRRQRPTLLSGSSSEPHSHSEAGGASSPDSGVSRSNSGHSNSSRTNSAHSATTPRSGPPPVVARRRYSPESQNQASASSPNTDERGGGAPQLSHRESQLSSLYETASSSPRQRSVRMEPNMHQGMHSAAAPAQRALQRHDSFGGDSVTGAGDEVFVLQDEFGGVHEVPTVSTLNVGQPRGHSEIGLLLRGEVGGGQGVFVAHVVRGGLAHRSRTIFPGDQIVGINGANVYGWDMLSIAVRLKQMTGECFVEIQREGIQNTIQIALNVPDNEHGGGNLGGDGGYGGGGSPPAMQRTASGGGPSSSGVLIKNLPVLRTNSY